MQFDVILNTPSSRPARTYRICYETFQKTKKICVEEVSIYRGFAQSVLYRTKFSNSKLNNDVTVSDDGAAHDASDDANNDAGSNA
jgi:hypothetical protein